MKDKIIVVEDNQELLELLATLLSESGYEVKAKATSNNLKQALIQFDPDLLLMDLWLEPVNADEIIPQVKAEEAYQNLPILLISAADNLEKIAQECQATAWINKPFDYGQLLKEVRALIDADS